MSLLQSRRSNRTFLFLLVWLVSIAYLAATINRGWIPYDDGALGQSAERVLGGEIPHVDFTDPYTGGLAFLNALTFRLLGVKLIWLRLPLFVLFVIWVPAVYAIAREFLNPLSAAGVTLVSVAWSVPNYPAALPSWFNLFFATFGVLAITKYIRREAFHWLVLAGFAGGCSFLFKSVGLYFIAAVLLFFVYREQSLSRPQDCPGRRSLAYLAFLTFTLSLFVAGLFKLVFNVAQPADFLHFVFPGFAIAALLIARERIHPARSSFARFRSLFRMAIPFLSSAAFPIALLLLFYWRNHAVAAWVHGVFVAPLLRMHYARRPPPDFFTEYPAVISLLFLMEVAALQGRVRSFLSSFLLVGAALVLVTSRSLDLSYLVAMESALGIVPVLVAASVAVLYRETSLDENGNSQVLFLLLATIALSSLIEFPFAQVMYFCYASAFAALLAASLASRLPNPPRAVMAGSVAFYVFFAIFVLRPGYESAWYNRDYDQAFLEQPRAGALRVSKGDADQYRMLIPYVKTLSRGAPIFAGPDAPEVYFLAHLKNPTRFLFDSIEEPFEYERLLRSLLVESDAIKLAVIKDDFDPSTGHLLILRHCIAPRFPNSRKFGKFTVYWRP
jgi:hypothetical protein